MACASCALRSSASRIQQAPWPRDCLPPVLSISRLCLRKRSFSHLRLCAAVHVRNGERPKMAFAASADDAASINVKGNESEENGRGSIETAVSEGSDTLSTETAHKNEDPEGPTGQKDDTSDAANKFIGVLRDTTEELKEQAEKARAALAATAQGTAAVLAATAQETAEKSRENLSYIAENAPDPIKDIADTALKAHSADTSKTFAKIHDFCLGIPYGTFLAVGGLLWFIISGSTAAIRFGVILGGILLGLSVSSLNAWKEGKPTSPYIKGQAVISSILAFREIRRLFEVKIFFPSAFVALVSVGMLGFYFYVLLAGGNPPPKKAKPAPAA